MTSTFLSLQIGVSALQATSLGVETTGHNIANANTPGYSRQTADLETEDSLGVYSDHRNFLGQGAKARGQNRVTDESLNAQFRYNNAQQSYWNTYSTEVGNVAKVFNEPAGTTLRQSMDAFYTAWSTLSQTPADGGARSAVYEASKQLADAFHNTSSAIQQDISRYQDEMGAAVNQTNQLASSIASLDLQIMKTTQAGTAPNDLLDQRDALLDKLSSYASVNVVHETDGSVTVQLNQASGSTVDLVAKGQVVATVSSSATVPSPQTTPPTVIVSGLQDNGGQLTSLNDMITYTQNVSGQVDKLAQDLAGAVNTQYNKGYDMSGNQPVGGLADLFTINGSGGVINAADIQVNTNLGTTNLDKLPASLTPPSGGQAYQTDGGNSDAIASQMGIYDQEYAGIVTQLGIDGQAANQQNQTFIGLTTQVTQLRTSVSGVNINEEMSNMIQFQQSYSAASKFISVFNDMLTTLIQSV